MKKTIYTIPLLLILVATSCKKVKLEDDERGKLLLGKWKYQYSGMPTGFNSYQKIAKPYKSYTIEFFEEGELCINDNGESKNYNIRIKNELSGSTYSLWKDRIYYGKKKDGYYFTLHYYSEDSISIDKLPYDMTSWGSQAGNMFYRVE